MTSAGEFIIADLRDFEVVKAIMALPKRAITFDEIYQFAADMGGAGFVFTGENDADIMHNSALVNLNVLEAIYNINQAKKTNQTRVFYSSSACMYHPMSG